MSTWPTQNCVLGESPAVTRVASSESPQMTRGSPGNLRGGPTESPDLLGRQLSSEVAWNNQITQKDRDGTTCTRLLPRGGKPQRSTWVSSGLNHTARQLCNLAGPQFSHQ